MGPGDFAPLTPDAAAALLAEAPLPPALQASLPYSPGGKRGGTLALLSFAAELEAAPGRVTEPMIGRIRFQWWRDAVAELFGGEPVRHHPLVIALQQSVPGMPGMRAALDAMIDGAETVLDATEPKDAASASALTAALYAPLGSALSLWLAGDDTRAQPVGRALALAAAVRAAAENHRPPERGLARMTDLIGPLDSASFAPLIEDHTRTLGRLPAALVPAALPFALAKAHASGKQPGPLAIRTRYLRAVLTGRF